MTEEKYKEFCKNSKEVKEYLKFRDNTLKNIEKTYKQLDSETDDSKKEILVKKITDFRNEILQNRLKTTVVIRKALGGPIREAHQLMVKQDWAGASEIENRVYFNE